MSITPEITGSASPANAPVPSSDRLLEPILEVLERANVMEVPDLVQAVGDILHLSDDARERRTPSGHTLLATRVGWARTSLVKAELVDLPGPALVAITDNGRDLLRQHRGKINGALLKDRIPAYVSWLADMGGELPSSERSAPDAPAAWMVRAGEGGIYAPEFVAERRVMLGWGATGSVAGLSRDEIAAAVGRAFPDLKRILRGQAANALYRLAKEIRQGDLILTPEPATRTLLLGEVAADYEWLDAAPVADYRHSRPVNWFARIDRDELSYGARNSLGSLLTLTKPGYEAELLRLAELHRGDTRPEPLKQAGRRTAATPESIRVIVPSNAEVPRRQLTGEFQTTPRKALTLLEHLDSGSLALPDFQRSFVWAPDATRELLVSMMRSFPAGALLLLQSGSETFKPRPVEGVDELRSRPSFLVLDGQQRLTSLYQAFYGVGDHRFFLDIGALLTGADVNEAVRCFSASRAAAFHTIESQARSLVMPLSLVRGGGAAGWRDDVMDLRSEGEHPQLRRLLREVETAFIHPLMDYAFPVTVLPAETPLEAVCTIFETLNRTGKPLSPFELISARAFAGGHSLRDMWLDAIEAHPILNDFDVQPYYILQCIALHLGQTCKRGTVLNLPSKEIARHWDETVADMASVLGLLRDECGVLVPKLLPYEPMLIPLAGAWRAIRGAEGPARGAMRLKLKRWFWCACFRGEYESSSASLAERDTPILRAWMSGGPPPVVVESFEWDPEQWRRTTVRQQGLYRATLALSVGARPRDFHTGAPLTPELIEAAHIDDHHVFPRRYLHDAGFSDLPDTVLNHCLIDRETNQRIGMRPPSAYLSEMRVALGHTVDSILESHLLPAGNGSPLERDDYPGFLSSRITRLASALFDLTGEPRPTVSPRSPLDLRVEAIELALRERVLDALNNDVGRLPSHVREHVEERVRSAVRRNPATELVFETRGLAARLEYCDLRELQDIIVSKPLWPAFEPAFGTREFLCTRFGQLAELRNRLRHSRTLDDITLKDGEAAVLWFEQQLAGVTV